MSTHVYISEPNVFIQKIWAHWPVPHHGTTKLAHQPNKKWYTHVSYNQGASREPPAAPPSGGGDGPPLPAPGSGGGTPVGSPCPGGRRPLAIAASTAARRMIDRHGGDNPTHFSRNSSSWICLHMSSGTSRRTISKRRTISSSTPAAAGGACDGPAPGSSQWHLCAGLSGPADPPAAASLRRLVPRGGLFFSRGTGTRTMSTSRPRGATSAQTPNKQQTKILVSIHQNMCTRISTNIL
jgi:hypothetical protein